MKNNHLPTYIKTSERYFAMKDTFQPTKGLTAIPYFDMPVRCGTPTMTGDVPVMTMMVPDEVAGRGDTFATRVVGDSMIDVGIESGDLLVIECTARYHSGDIIMADIDGERTLKTYYIDENGEQWLVPANSNYEARLISGNSLVRFVGRLKWHTRPAPQDSTRNIISHIKRTKALHSAPPRPTQEDIDAAIACIGQEITLRRQWFAVFRTLTDMELLAVHQYDVFCQRVAELLPSHQHLPVEAELRRVDVQSFTKPVSLWREDNAPVSGKRFNDYLLLAQKTRSIIEGNTL